MFKSILVPTDGAQLSAKAIKVAINIARAYDAKITMLHVMPAHQMFLDDGFVLPKSASRSLNIQFKKQASALSKEILEAARSEAAAAGVACAAASVVGKSPYETIINQAKKLNCDLIVMASHGRKGLEGLLLGSETTKVLVHSKTPVMVVR